MKRLTALLFLMLMCIPMLAQQVTIDPNLSAEYKKYNNIKKTGVAGIVVCGATWLAGNVICVVEQNLYVNDRWDGNDLEELARLSSEAKEQPAYKRGTAIAIAGCLGTGISVFLTAKYGAKARNIRNRQGDIVASLGMDLSPTGASLKLTF